MSLRLDIPDDADPEEVAAIATAIRSFTTEEQENDESQPAWQGDRWAFTGRICTLQQRKIRTPTRAPSDAWSAAGRTDRF